MVTLTLKSGKVIQAGIDFPTLSDLLQDQNFDMVAIPNDFDELSVFIIPKTSIDCIEVTWNGTKEELDEMVKQNQV